MLRASYNITYTVRTSFAVGSTALSNILAYIPVSA